MESLQPVSPAFAEVISALRETAAELRRQWRRYSGLVTCLAFVISAALLFSIWAFQTVLGNLQLDMPYGVSMSSLIVLALHPPILMAWAAAFALILPLAARNALGKQNADGGHASPRTFPTRREIMISCQVAAMLFAPTVVQILIAIAGAFPPLSFSHFIPKLSVTRDWMWIMSSLWFIAALPFFAAAMPASIAEPRLNPFDYAIRFGRHHLLPLLAVVAISAGPLFLLSLLYETFVWDALAQTLMKSLGFSGQLPATMLDMMILLAAILAATLAVSYLFRSATLRPKLPEEILRIFD